GRGLGGPLAEFRHGGYSRFDRGCCRRRRARHAVPEAPRTHAAVAAPGRHRTDGRKHQPGGSIQGNRTGTDEVLRRPGGQAEMAGAEQGGSAGGGGSAAGPRETASRVAVGRTVVRGECCDGGWYRKAWAGRNAGAGGDGGGGSQRFVTL